MEMGNLSMRRQSRANTHREVCTLIRHGVLRVDVHQSTLCVHTIQGSLGATQYIDTIHVVEMVVEGSLRHQRNVVVVDTHRRIVDA